ncbi:hypothetical protein AVEN_164901-1 [Araneus ventricosus]|uniref:Uncharacterized protein n=1 Tax=Araneus ventricosus TaxID=182803 RepID=A0A4Y2DT81_ARAVE|nr:hypothetical protein AVEN_164901-1 [Araneus ventricosus]
MHRNFLLPQRKRNLKFFNGFTLYDHGLIPFFELRGWTFFLFTLGLLPTVVFGEGVQKMCTLRLAEHPPLLTTCRHKAVPADYQAFFLERKSHTHEKCSFPARTLQDKGSRACIP